LTKRGASRAFCLLTAGHTRCDERPIVPLKAFMLESGMVPDRQIVRFRRVVLDDRCRLPGRFFGRRTAAALPA